LIFPSNTVLSSLLIYASFLSKRPYFLFPYIEGISHHRNMKHPFIKYAIAVGHDNFHLPYSTLM
jgi:hypothetical protein